MDTNPVLEAIKSRRAIRSYEDKPVPESAIEMMLEAATYAPSAPSTFNPGNSQSLQIKQK